ncbi:hypothetical protein [Dapis sp. BLCC M229]|uniref:hypothetical protein n=1 Tax=Dapis sp. BLCC M229 TaxID=3400188 RepID=UPI003CF860B4
MSIIVGTRIYSVSNSHSKLYQLESWCKNTLKYADHVVIATNDRLFNEISQIVSGFENQVSPLLIHPWTGFTHPLNAIVVEANFQGAHKLLLQSLEVYVSSKDVEKLNAYLTSDTLVVGAKMISNHGADRVGVQPIDGMNSPWNTLALWNLSKLNVTGFLGISSGLIKDIPGGMEEVSTISLLQQLYPNEARAKLIALSDLKWITNWRCEKRKNFHEEKMNSKFLRAERQLEYSKIKRGYVTVLPE